MPAGNVMRETSYIWVDRQCFRAGTSYTSHGRVVWVQVCVSWARWDSRHGSQASALQSTFTNIFNLSLKHTSYHKQSLIPMLVCASQKHLPFT